MHLLGEKTDRLSIVDYGASAVGDNFQARPDVVVAQIHHATIEGALVGPRHYRDVKTARTRHRLVRAGRISQSGFKVRRNSTLRF
jgi:hypothetical protein